MSYSHRPFRIIAALPLMAGLAACATLPRLDEPRGPRTQESLASAQSLAGTAEGQFPDAVWWQAYHDPALNALMAEALASSPDMRAAAARIAAADALAEQAGAAQAPSVALDGQAGGTKQSYNMGIPAQFVPKGVVGTGRVSASMAYNLDLWGRNLAALRAARGEAEAARVDAAQARLVLTTSLATAWVEFGQALTARDIAAEAKRLRQHSEDLTRDRVAAGIDAQTDLELARSRQATAAADLAGAEEAVALSRNRLAALLGAGPDRGANLPKPIIAARAPLPLPSALAAGLLGRRPDLVAARLRTEAAGARVKMARRDFYPNINLTALAGVQSLGLSNLFDKGSQMASFGPAISLPLFDGGRLAGRYRAAHASYGEAIARYDQTLIMALRETADLIAARRFMDTRLTALATADQAATAAASMALGRYQQGIGNVLQANAAADAALAALRAHADARARVLTLDIALIRALGGGFRDSPSAKDVSAP